LWSAKSETSGAKARRALTFSGTSELVTFPFSLRAYLGTVRHAMAQANNRAFSAFLISLAGQAAELVYGFDYGLRGYVVGDFYFADFSRQDEMHDSVASLFIGLEQA
jgi:hypothetical protein